MAGKFRFTMDQKDITRFLTTTVDSFIQDRLINKEQRINHKEQCAERLAAEDGSCDKDTEVEYSDQAILANLDWGIEALEEAISTYNMETKLARLDHAEKMLQVCAMLNPKQKTAGVPNFYLSAWAHLNLSYLWKLRNNTQNCIFHALEMFVVDPFFSRIDFAPELWKILFLPHMSSIIGWYSEERHKLMMEVIPDSSDLSFTADFDQFFNESLVLSMRPHQLDKLQKLEKLYGESLDENTRLYAKYYKDCMNSDSTSSKKVPMLPIAEPPMTPLHELSRSVPDYVKFGPILPKSAGFSSISSSKDNANERLEFIHTVFEFFELTYLFVLCICLCFMIWSQKVCCVGHLFSLLKFNVHFISFEPHNACTFSMRNFSRENSTSSHSNKVEKSSTWSAKVIESYLYACC